MRPCPGSTGKSRNLREIVDEIVRQFQVVDAAVANGPHVELSCQELRVVELLGDEGPRIMREVAGFLRLAVNSVTSLIDHLEAKRIVRRKRSAEAAGSFELTSPTRADRRTRRPARSAWGSSAACCRPSRTRSRDIFIVLFRKIARAGRSQVERNGGDGIAAGRAGSLSAGPFRRESWRQARRE